MNIMTFWWLARIILGVIWCGWMAVGAMAIVAGLSANDAGPGLSVSGLAYWSGALMLLIGALSGLAGYVIFNH